MKEFIKKGKKLVPNFSLLAMPWNVAEIFCRFQVLQVQRSFMLGHSKNNDVSFLQKNSCSIFDRISKMMKANLILSCISEDRPLASLCQYYTHSEVLVVFSMLFNSDSKLYTNLL